MIPENNQYIKFIPSSSRHPSSEYRPRAHSSFTHLKWKKFFLFGIAFLVLNLFSRTLWLPIFRSSSFNVSNKYGPLETFSQAAVSQTQPWQPNPKQKFLVRDWSIWLGWNNNRYIIESALMIAKLLDRTLVLPAFTYATACEYSDQVCASLAAMLVQDVPLDLNRVSNRTKYPDPDHGENFLLPRLPGQNGKGWVLPIEKLLDVDHLISTWGNVIRFEDFLKITNSSIQSIGTSKGTWNPDYNPNMTYKKIPQPMFSDWLITKVDRIPKPITPLIGKTKTKSSATLIARCESFLARAEESLQKLEVDMKILYMDWSSLKTKGLDETQQIELLDPAAINGDQIRGNISAADALILESCLASNGMRTAHTYNHLSLWMKAPYKPVKVFHKLTNMMGWWDELHKFDEQILHLEGEFHDRQPAAGMIWTSPEGREQYERLTREAVRPPNFYHSIAARLELKIRARCGGRSWVAAHLRRGDFGPMRWSDPNIIKHWKIVETNIGQGIEILQKHSDLLKPSHQNLGTSLVPPRVEDPIYIATNVRGEEVNFLRKKNVILLQDLIDDDDRLELGFSAMFMDTLSVLEQCLLMRAGFYFGDAHSSVDGWVLNGREHYGINQTLTRIEYMYGPYW